MGIRYSSRFFRYWLCLLLLVGVQLGLSGVRAFSVPLWTGYHHERDSYNVVRIALAQGRLPNESDFLPGEFELRQGSQPPLYTLLSLPAVALFDDGESLDLPSQGTPYCIGGERMLSGMVTNQSYNAPYSGAVRGGYALRLMNSLYLSLAVIFVGWAGRVFLPDAPLFGLVAAGVLAFDPYHGWISATIINDGLLLTIAALVTAFGLLTLKRPSVWSVLGLVVASIASLLVKVSGWVLVGGAVLVLGQLLVKHLLRGMTARTWAITGGVTVTLLVVTTAIGLFNVQQYGSVLGRYGNLDQLLGEVVTEWRTLPNTVALTLNFTRYDAMGVLGESELARGALLLYQAGLIGIFFLPLAAIVLTVVLRDWAQLLAVLWLTAVIIATIGLVVARNHIAALGDGVLENALVYAPVRYYVLAVPAWVLLMGYTLKEVTKLGGGFVIQRSMQIIGIITVICIFAISVWGLWGYTPTRLMRQFVLTQVEFNARSEDIIEASAFSESLPAVLASDIALDSARNWLDFGLYFSTNQPLTVSWSPEITLEDANGRVVRCQTLPLYGYFPAPRWQPKTVIHQPLRVRNCQTPLVAPIEIRFNWWSPEGSSNSLILSTLESELGLSEGCPNHFGVVENALQIIEKRTPEDVLAGTVYEPYLDYFVVQPISRVQERVFTLTEIGSNSAYSCVGLASIHGGNLSFGEARQGIAAGDRIFLDSCAIFIPEDALRGEYLLTVAFTDSAGDEIPVILADGSAQTALRLATVNVR